MKTMDEDLAGRVDRLPVGLDTCEVVRLLGITHEHLEREFESDRLAPRAKGAARMFAQCDLDQYRANLRAKHQAALESVADDAHRLGLDC